MVNFTEKELNNLPNPQPGKRKVYHDNKIKGLGVRITSNGIKSFIVRANIHGKTKTVTLGRHPSMKIEIARKLAREALNTFSFGVNPNDEKRNRRIKSITLQQTMDDYIASRNKHLKQKTINDYRVLFNGFLSEWKNKELRDISRNMVEKKHSKIGEKSIYRANATMRLLRALFNYADGAYEDSKGQSIIINNPVQRISNNKAWFREKSRDNIIQPNDLKAWFITVKNLPNHHINTIRNNISETVSDYLIFILFTGLRQSEAAGLLWKDVDFNNSLFTVRDTKNRTDHTLPLTGYTSDLLKSRQKNTNSDFVFSGNNPEKSIVNPYKQIKKIREESGVHFTMHDLRRTFATIADILDIQFHVIKRLMNHSNNDVTSLHYIKSSKEKLRAPMQQITQYILDKVK
jgi:integrase